MEGEIVFDICDFTLCDFLSEENYRRIRGIPVLQERPSRARVEQVLTVYFA
jgi:hypothetical protein